MTHNYESFRRTTQSLIEAWGRLTGDFPVVEWGTSGTVPPAPGMMNLRPKAGHEPSEDKVRELLPSVHKAKLKTPSYYRDSLEGKPRTPEEMRGLRSGYEFQVTVKYEYDRCEYRPHSPHTGDEGIQTSNGTITVRFTAGEWSVEKWENGGEEEFTELIELLPDNPNLDKDGFGFPGAREAARNHLERAKAQRERWREDILKQKEKWAGVKDA